MSEEGKKILYFRQFNQRMQQIVSKGKESKRGTSPAPHQLRRMMEMEKKISITKTFGEIVLVVFVFVIFVLAVFGVAWIVENTQPQNNHYWKEYVNCVPFDADQIKENLDTDECGTGQWTHAYHNGLDCEVIEHGTKSELLIRQEQFHFNYCKALMEAKNEQ